MRTRFLDQMAMYSAYHRHPANRRLHMLGVPSITLGLLLLLAFVRLGHLGIYPVSLATLFAAIVMGYWLLLDRAIGLITIALYLPLVAAAAWLGSLADPVRWTVFAVAFFGGWVVQLVGHRIEGRKPALLDNLAQIFIAPLFLTAESLFGMGRKRDLHAAIEERWTAYAK